MIKAPQWLRDKARTGGTASVEACAFWADTAPMLEQAGRLTLLDVPAFTRLAVSFGLMQEAAAQLLDEGLTIEATERGKDVTKRHPAALVYQTQEQIVRAGLAEFGMTPQARRNLRGPADSNTPDSAQFSGEGVLD